MEPVGEAELVEGARGGAGAPLAVRAPRILILSASVGAGHDKPAEVLAAGLVAERPGVEVEIVDGLAAMGSTLFNVAHHGASVISRRATWLLDLEYLLFARLAPTRALGQAGLVALGARGLRRLVAQHRPDVIVSTYPGVTEVLRHVRRRGLLDTPVVSAITDLSALRYWAGRGVDLHLISHPESEAEVRRLAGRDTRVVAVRGLVEPGFTAPLDAAAARRALDLPADGQVVIVSGGGWGVGDLAGAAQVALDAGSAAVLCLCGSNAEGREALERRFAGEPRLRALGFTDRMCELLSAADVLVHASAGLTALEGLMRGCHVISYGWGVAHIRLNNRAYRRFGLARVATTPAALARALREAAQEPAPVDDGWARLPSAAALILAEAGAEAQA